MAYASGTATDHVDLYNKLLDFLTSNADLVNAGEEWSVAWEHPDASYPYSAGQAGSDTVLRGPGAAGADEIYVGMRLDADAANDLFGMWFAGAQGVVASSVDYSDHVNSARPMHMPLFDQAMPYWFVANGRRFIVVVKISTTFAACYNGLFLPYATPTEYPYPMISSGCSGTARRWSDENAAHSHFCMPWNSDPSNNYSGITAAEDARTQVMSPSGEWVFFDNRRDGYAVFPWRGGNGSVDFVHSQRALFGGDHMLYPATLVSTGSRLRGTLGVFEGVFHVTGFGNAAENILTIGGVDHLVVQNLFRTGFTDYWALRLA